jgi:Lipocalin-like domain
VDQANERGTLVGAWRLASWENQAADGRFSVTISRKGRAAFAADDLLGGTIPEKEQAMESFLAYAGRYSFLGDRVIHHMELSLFPNWIGRDQERWVELVGTG